jgi:hypothetical protein
MSAIQNEAILFTTYYEDVPAGKSSKTTTTTSNEKIPEFTDFHISNIKCSKATVAISITGLPIKPVNNIYFENLEITSGQGFVSTDAKDIYLDNVQLNSAEPLYSTSHSKNIMVDGKSVE